MNSNAFNSCFLAFFHCPWSFASLIIRKRWRLFDHLSRPDTLDCDEFSLDRTLCNAENTRFPLELEVSGRDVLELTLSSSKIFFTNSGASPRQDDNFERDEWPICAENCSLFYKMAVGKTMKTGEEFVSVNRCVINLWIKINSVERSKKCWTQRLLLK